MTTIGPAKCSIVESFAIESQTPDGKSSQPISSQFRTILPQIIASTGKNLLIIDVGLMFAMPTIVIPALRGLQPERYPDETLSLSASQATWFASMALFMVPIGCLVSGWVAERIGRKRSMLLACIPPIVAWPMLGLAPNIETLFVANVLLGVGSGFTEAPVTTYIAEICQPSMRGILTSCAGLAVMFGTFFVYLLGAIATWRNAMLICTAMPISAFIAISFLPETPLWLLSKNRVADAERSLRWLRGWRSRQEVADEFAEMQRYSETAVGCPECQSSDTAIKCTHSPAGFADNMREMLRKPTMRPMGLVLFCFLIAHFGGMVSIRSYLVQIFQVFGVSKIIDPNWMTVLIGIISMLGIISNMAMIHIAGRRSLYFISLAGVAFSCLSIGFCALDTLPLHVSSFELNSTDTAAATVTIVGLEEPISAIQYFVATMFLTLAFCACFGASTIPWLYLGDSFPLKTRGLATGIAAALSYCFLCAATKSYALLETNLTLSGSFIFFGCVNVCGLISLYFVLPETENRTLEEIEQYFSDNERKITDRHIRKIIK